MILPEDPDRLLCLGGWRGYFRFIWLHWLATFRLSEYAVCVMSKGKGYADDYHDYRDSIEGHPDHFTELTCKRCGKKFTI